MERLQSFKNVAPFLSTLLTKFYIICLEHDYFGKVTGTIVKEKSKKSKQ
jgi:hypothetical protein